MCKFASFVLTKDREVWLSESDSHEDIIAAHELTADGARGPNIIRVEIVPGPTIKTFDDLAGWRYRVDQDILPAWADALRDEERARKALARRAEEGFKTVDARGCTALTSLDAKAAEYVDARGCTALKIR